MSDKIQKRPTAALREKGQYLLAFAVVGSMLLVADFPLFVIFFFGIFAYFLFRIFSSASRHETRDIFEFYLGANEILRDDGRSWFGFEVRDAIARGEAIVNRMTGAPPLLYFALGALYNKAGEHQSAINTLTPVVESEKGNESAYVFPTPELRNYVKILRKIERDPSEAPLTSAAIRSLERTRRLRGKQILENSRAAFVQANANSRIPEQLTVDVSGQRNGRGPSDSAPEAASTPLLERLAENGERQERPNGTNHEKSVKRKEKKDPFANRKPISEVLHDIYDRNVQ